MASHHGLTQVTADFGQDRSILVVRDGFDDGGSPLGRVAGLEDTQGILEQAQPKLDQFGIELVDVRIKRLDYVESVREKVYARMVSERKRIAAQFRSEGEGQSAEILGTMEKELRQIRSTAYRRVQEIHGKGDAEATRIYGDSFGRNPEFYAFHRTLEVYREGSNKNSVLILTTDSDFYRYLKQAIPDAQQSLRTGAH